MKTKDIRKLRRSVARPDAEAPQVANVVQVHPEMDLPVVAPNGGAVGEFLEKVDNMFRARAMRMNGLLTKINDSGTRTECLLKEAASRMEAAEDELRQQLEAQGLA